GRGAEHLFGGRGDGRERAPPACHQLAVDEQLTLAIVAQAHTKSPLRCWTTVRLDSFERYPQTAAGSNTWPSLRRRSAFCTVCFWLGLARSRPRRITWTCVQRSSGCDHRVATQPSAGGDLPQ